MSETEREAGAIARAEHWLRCLHPDYIHEGRRENMLDLFTELRTLRADKARLEEMALDSEAMDTEPWAKVERIARRILNRHYPLNLFDGSSGDPGPVITSALHGALAALDAARPPRSEAESPATPAPCFCVTDTHGCPLHGGSTETATDGER